VIKLTIAIKFIVCLAVTFSAALSASLFTRSALSEWYINLNKPFFTPPDWLFGPVWTVLYLLMALSALLVWNKGLTNAVVRIALVLYLLQLILNFLWTPIFFVLRMPFFAFIEILLLWTAIVLTILVFARVSTAAALLLVPYILWTSFAAVLNLSIWLLNS
jgi:tryptophan-rich sensory protein